MSYTLFPAHNRGFLPPRKSDVAKKEGEEPFWVLSSPPPLLHKTDTVVSSFLGRKGGRGLAKMEIIKKIPVFKFCL